VKCNLDSVPAVKQLERNCTLLPSRLLIFPVILDFLSTTCMLSLSHVVMQVCLYGSNTCLRQQLIASFYVFSLENFLPVFWKI